MIEKNDYVKIEVENIGLNNEKFIIQVNGYFIKGIEEEKDANGNTAGNNEVITIKTKIDKYYKGVLKEPLKSFKFTELLGNEYLNLLMQIKRSILNEIESIIDKN